jgi:uncharacterized tellurite resistance protein B-like protein
MELTKEQLYDAFGELLYAVAQVDGEVQESEAKKIEQMLKNFAGAEEIEWSFEYEYDKKQTVEEAYKKAIDVCKWYGPSPDYTFLFDLVEQVATASDGLSEDEAALIARFRSELMAHFQKNVSNDED